MKKNILILLLLSLINISSAQAIPPLNESIAYLAYLRGDVDMVDKLLSNGALSSHIVVHTTAIPDHNAVRRRFSCQYGSPLNIPDERNQFENAYLHHSMQRTPPAVKILSLRPLLLTAISEGRSEFFDTLLQHVDVNEVEYVRNNNHNIQLDTREPALHEAIKLVAKVFQEQEIEDFSIITKLLEANVSITSKNLHDETPLEVAVGLDPSISFSIVRLICDHAMKKDIADFGLFNAYKAAMCTTINTPSQSNFDMVDLLEEYPILRKI